MSFKPSAGEVFLNKYEIVSLVGEGAFGSVYRARDIKLDRIVAIKFINIVNDVLERFNDELEAIKGLDHPNIVRLYDFDILKNGLRVAHADLRIPGEHNIANGLAAFAAAVEYGVDPVTAAEGLSSYEGIARRMEKLCVTDRGADVYSDYAHHPTEIAATLKGARAVCSGKLRVVFQPHTYSRTAELFDGFVSAFAESGADEVFFCDIYAARETNIYGVSSEQLAEAVEKAGKPASRLPSFADAADTVYALSGPGDMILVMGAGDVEKVGELLTEKKN